MAYKDWSPERQAEYWKRIKKIKAAHPDKVYPSEYHHMMLELSLLAANTMCNLEAWYTASVFPFAGLGRELPRSVHKYTSQALIHAAALGDTEMCENLYKDFKVDVNVKDTMGNTPLFGAVERKRLPAARWLLEHGAKILPNKGGYNPVLKACEDGCIPALNMFKYYGINFNEGYTYWSRAKSKILPQKLVVYPLVIASLAKQPKSVQFLIDNGASIDTPLFDTKKTVRDLINTSFIDKETNDILAQKAAETPIPQNRVSRSLFTRKASQRNVISSR